MSQWVYRRPHFRRQYVRKVLLGIAPVATPSNDWLAAHVRRVTGRPRTLDLGVRGFRPEFRPPTISAPVPFLALHVQRAATRSRELPEWRRPFRPKPHIGSFVRPTSNEHLAAHVRRMVSRNREQPPWRRPFRSPFIPLSIVSADVPSQAFIAEHVRRMVSRDRRQPYWVRPFQGKLPLLGPFVITPSNEWIAAHVRRMTSRQGRRIPRWLRPQPPSAPLYPLLGVSSLVTTYLTGRVIVVSGGATDGIIRSGGATKGQVVGGGLTDGKVV